MRIKFIIIIPVLLLSLLVASCTTNKQFQEQNKKRIEAQNKLRDAGVPFSDHGFFLEAEKGNLTNLQLFLDAGKSPNIKDNGTALLYAVRANRLEVVKFLVEHGANVNERTFWGDPIAMASYKGYYKIAEYLINNGANVDSESNDGMTPLLNAVVTGKTNIVNLLLENGADPNFVQRMTRDTSLIIAAKKGYTDIIVLLVKNGADVNYRGVGGFTALNWALLDDRVEIARLLLENGAFVNGNENNVGRPMIDALEHGNESNDFKLADMLIKHGVNINAKILGDMPLIVWCAKRRLDKSVAFLKSKGADINAASNNGLTALDYALQYKDEKLIKLLKSSK